jgi:hypothetical protein
MPSPSVNEVVACFNERLGPDVGLPKQAMIATLKGRQDFLEFSSWLLTEPRRPID